MATQSKYGIPAAQTTGNPYGIPGMPSGATKKKKKKKGRSGDGGFLGLGVGPSLTDVMNEAGRSVEGLATDVAGLGALAGGTVKDVGLMGYRLATGDEEGAREAAQDVAHNAGAMAAGFTTSLVQTASHVADVVPDVGDVDLGQDIRDWWRDSMVELASDGDPRKRKIAEEVVDQYADPKPLGKLVDERGYLSPIIEDVGNLAMAGRAVKGTADLAAGTQKGLLSKAFENPTKDILSGAADSGALGKIARAGEHVAHPYQGAYKGTIGQLGKAASAERLAAAAPVDPLMAEYRAAHGMDPVERGVVQKARPVEPSRVGKVFDRYNEGATTTEEFNALPFEDRAAVGHSINEDQRIYDFLQSKGVKFTHGPADASPYYEGLPRNADGTVQFDPEIVGERIRQDIAENNHVYVDDTGSFGEQAPVAYTPEQNNVRRAVHDYLGHRKGAGFDTAGENLAYMNEADWYSPEAQRAAAFQQQGSAAHLNETGTFAPEQRTGALPADMADPQYLAGAAPWARKVAQRLRPEGIIDNTLNRLEGMSQRNFVKSDLYRRMNRMLTAERNRLLHDPAVVDSVGAGKFLVDEFGVSPAQANEIVGRHVTSVVDGTDAYFNDLLAQDPTLQPYLEAAGWSPEKLPKEVLENADPRSVKVYETMIEHAADNWRKVLDTRYKQLVESRLGTKGLERVGDMTVEASKAQERSLRNAAAMQSKAEKLRARAVKEGERNLAEQGFHGDKATRALDKIKQAIKDKDAAKIELQEAQKVKVKGFKGKRWDAAKTHFVDAVLGERRGATYHPATGRFIHTAADTLDDLPEGVTGEFGKGYGVSVGNGSLMEIDPATWAEHGEDILDAVALDYSDMLANSDYSLGAWADDDGTIHLDINQDRIGGTPMERAEATLMAQARGQKAIINYTGDDAFPGVAPSAKVAQAMLASSEDGLNARLSVARRGYQALERTFKRADGTEAPLYDLTAADIDNKMIEWDYAAWNAHVNNPEKYPTPADFYKDLEVRFNKKAPKGQGDGVLYQTVLNKGVDMESVEWARQTVGDYKNVERWYHNTKEFVDRNFKGKTITLLNGRQVPADVFFTDALALMSVQASPHMNLRFAMTGYNNLQEFMTEMDGNVAAVQKLMEDMQSLPAKKRTSSELWKRLMKNRPHPTESANRPFFDLMEGRLLDEMDNDYFANIKTEKWGETRKTQPKAGMSEREFMEDQASSMYAKIRSFKDNMYDPANSTSVTLDSWMARAFGIHSFEERGAYAAYANKMRDLADELSTIEGRRVPPHEVQALFWAAAMKEINELDAGVLRAQGTRSAQMIEDGTWTREANPIQEYIDAEDARLERGQGRLERGENWREMEQEDVWVDRGEGPKQEPRTSYMHRPAKSSKPNATQAEWVEAQRAAANKVMDKVEEKLAAGDVEGAKKEVLKWQKSIITNKTNEAAASGDFAEVVKHMTPKMQEAQDRWGLTNEALFQKWTKRIRGSFQATDDQYITKFFQGADPTTLVHEGGHLVRRLLGDDALRQIEESMGFRSNGKPWTRGREEQFADLFTAYMATGNAPEAVRPVFDRLKATLAARYEHMGRKVNADLIPAEMSEVFDRWFADPDIPDVVDQLPTLVGKGKRKRVEMLPVREGTNMVDPAHFAAGPPDLRGQSGHQGYGTGVQVEKARLKIQKAEARARAAEIAHAKAGRAVADLQATLRDQSLPSQIAADALDARARKTIERTQAAIDGRGAQHWPAEYRHIGVVLDKLKDEAKNNPALADVLEDFGTNFPDVLARAKELGLDPRHIRDFSDAEVKRLIHGMQRVGVNEATAGTRKASLGIRAREGTAARSIEALAASMQEVYHERLTNSLVDGLETQVVVPWQAGQEIPKGWVGWDARKASLLGQEGEKLQHGVTGIIPKQVDTFLRRQQQDFNHGVFKGIQKVTNPWRGLVLTLSPRWYVNNFISNAILATVEGVSLKDWKRAWTAYRNKEDSYTQMRDLSFVSDIDAQDALIRPSNTKQAIQTADGVGQKFKAARQHVGYKLRRMNEVVDEISRTAVFERSLRKGASAEHALERAQRALVDFQNMSPFEQQVVRSIVPFYAWQKNILQLAAKMPIDHPIASGLAVQFGAINNDLLRDKFGGEMPFGYTGLVPMPGGGAISTRGFNPFMDSASLITPEGIGNSLNPFVDIALRKALGAPEGGFVDQRRLSSYGTAVPDTSVPMGLGELVEGVPGAQIGASAVGSGRYGVGQQGLKFLGLNALTEEDVKKVINRTKAAKAQIRANAPFPAQPKKKGSSGSKSPYGIPG